MKITVIVILSKKFTNEELVKAVSTKQGIENIFVTLTFEPMTLEMSSVLSIVCDESKFDYFHLKTSIPCIQEKNW